MKTSNSRKVVIDEDEILWTHYGTKHKVHEYLKRRARRETHNSVNRVIDNLLPRTWRTDLDRMRDEDRKLGFKDHIFFHSAIKQRMGIKYKPGRQRRFLTSSDK